MSEVELNSIVSLNSVLKIPEKRKSVVKDAVELLENEVKSKSGLSGAFLRTGYGVVKAFRPNYVEHVMESTIDSFAEAIEPFHATYREKPESDSFEPVLMANKKEAAGRMLAIADKRAEHMESSSILKIYQKLRPTAEQYVIDALPGLAKLIDKHTIQN